MGKMLFLLLLFCQTMGRAQDHAPGLERLKAAEMAARGLVVLNNGGGELPLQGLPALTIASVHFAYPHAALFDSIAGKYWRISSFSGDTVSGEAGFNMLHDKLKLYNLVIVECSAGADWSAGLSDFIGELSSRTRVVVVLSGDGKGLLHLEHPTVPVIWSGDDAVAGATLAAQALFGGVGVSNRLVTGYGVHYPKGAGYTIRKVRLGYSVPEAVGVNSDDLRSIDSIAMAGIAAHSAPAMVILLARDGQVIYSKAFGKHTYFGNDSTRLDDIFDMASCTKVTATTPAIMHLYETRQLNLDSPIAVYVRALQNIPDKKDIRVREALLHEAGFTPYIKFYEKLRPGDMSTDSSAAYPTPVADHYYLRANYFNEVQWPVTLASPVLTRGKYVYSDLSMYMMKEVFENISHQKLNEYILQELYLPLGMQSTGFLPRNRFPRSRIIPTTENDNWMRDMPVVGYVNDPGAAMAGGVEGHAGLFADANDLAIYYQLLLNGGSYGGKRYFDSATVKYFTSRQSRVTYRGLGFDRTNMEKIAPGDHRSDQAFGHSGYTGTYVWVDPQYHMVFICLTNRVYPDDGKTFGVSKVNVRQLALDAFYNAVVKEKQ